MIRHITRAGGDRFQVYGQHAGKKCYVGTQEQIAAGELPPEVDQKRTLAASLDAWLASLAAGEAGSHRAYSEQIGIAAGDRRANNVGKPQVMRWRDERVGEFTPTTVNSALACLSAAFTDFVARGWVPANPCFGVRQLEVPTGAYNWIKTRPELERLLLTCPTSCATRW